MPSARGARGQSTVELALCLPALAFVLALVVEVGLVAGDQVRLWHAAREAARVAVVDPDLSDIEEAAARSGLEGIDVSVSPEPNYRVQGEPLEVDVEYRPGGHIPLIGELFSGLTMRASAAMRIEEP